MDRTWAGAASGPGAESGDVSVSLAGDWIEVEAAAEVRVVVGAGALILVFVGVVGVGYE